MSEIDRALLRIAENLRETKDMEKAHRVAMTRLACDLEDEWYGTEAEALVERYASR